MVKNSALATAVQIVRARQHVELLRYCAPDKESPVNMAISVTCELIDETTPVAPTTRDIKAEVRWEGVDARGGGTVEFDLGRGTILSLVADSVNIRVFNNSTQDTKDQNFNAYRVEVSVKNETLGTRWPIVSQREAVEVEAANTNAVRIPSYAESLQVMCHPVIVAPNIAYARFYQDLAAFALGNALYQSPAIPNITVDPPRIPVASGAEYVDVTNPDAAARTFVLVWRLRL